MYTTIEDKNEFYGKHFKTLAEVEAYVRSARVCSDGTPYDNFAFTLKNFKELEKEFKLRFAELEHYQDDDDKKDSFWLFCYYRCQQFIQFYGESAYDCPDELANYQQLAAKIKDYFMHCDVVELPQLPTSLTADSAYLMVNNNLFYATKSANLVKFKEIMLSPQQLSQFKEAIKPSYDARRLSRKELHYIRDVFDKHDNPESWLKKCFKVLRDDIFDLLKTPFHTSAIKRKIGVLNMFRIYAVFNRIMASQTLRYLRSTNLLDAFEHLMKRTIDEERIIHKMESINPIMFALSVGFYAARFLINALTLLKHVCLPKGAAKTEQLKWYDRLSFEVHKRHVISANDGVWAAVNLFTNYPQITHMSGLVAGWITIGFLVFDISLLLWQCHLAANENARMEDKYKQEIRDYRAHKAKLCGNIKDLLKKILASEKKQPLLIAKLKKQTALVAELDQQIAMNKKDLKRLDLARQVQNATLRFNIMAGVLLASGFTAAFIFAAAPTAAVLALLLCSIGVAMYLSTNEYNNYKKQSLYFFKAKSDHKKKLHSLSNRESLDLQTMRDYQQALHDYQTARREFIIVMIRNITLPSLIIGLVAVYWPAAVIVASGYIGYKMYQHVHEKAAALKVDDPVKPTAGTSLPNANQQPRQQEEEIAVTRTTFAFA